MVDRPILARSSAFLIAAIACLGLALQFDASLPRYGSIALTLWGLLRFFTIISNLLVAILFSGIAAGRTGYERSALTGGAGMMMMLVGVVYALLLRGLTALSGGEIVADFLLHTATPILVPLFWLLFVPRGQLGWRDPWAWSVVPVLYLPYALLRGAVSGIYAYPFLDVARLGGMRVAVNACAIAIAYLAAAFLIVKFDRRLAQLRYRPGANGKSSAS